MNRTQAQHGPHGIATPWIRPRRAAQERPLGSRPVAGSGRFRNRTRGREVAPVDTLVAACPATAQWDGACEPDLASVLADPIVALVMARDGLSVTDVATMLGHARARLTGTEQPDRQR